MNKQTLLTLLIILLLAVGCAGAEETPTTAPQPTAVEEPTDTSTDDEEPPLSDGDFTLNEATAAKIANGEPLNIIVSYHDVSNEFAPFIRMGVERADEEFSADVQFVGPVSPDADAQISELESLVATGVDGIAISSVSSDALAPIIDRFIEQGIPVVTYNTDNGDSMRLAFAGQDLEQSGYEAGKVFAEALGGEGDVIITTLDAAAQWSLDREAGARRALEEYAGINILQTVSTGTDPQEIYGSIENAMLANPTVNGILSLECCSTPAAGEYVVRNGLVGEVLVVGFDELPQTLDLIEQGAVIGSLSQAPERQSYEAVRMLLDFLNGDAIADVDTGIAVIDAENVAAFREAMGGDMSEESSDDGMGDFTLNEATAAKIANGEPLNIIVSYHDVSNEFAPFIRLGAERANEEFSADVQFVGPVSPDADAQISELESLVATGVDGIAISSVSSDALAPIIDRFIEQGIPVVTYNTDNSDSMRLAFAGQDLEQSGYEAGKVFAEALGGEGDVIITTLDAAAQWSLDREAGARRALEEYAGINILQTVSTGTDPQEIYGSIENAMLANPTVNGILSLECCSTPAAGEYVVRNGLVGEVLVVGFDELPQTLDLIEQGAVIGSLSQAPERQSYEAVRMLLDFLNGDAIADVDTGIAVIDAENVTAFREAMEQE